MPSALPDRARWEAVADGLLLALRPHASEDCALILPPGKRSRSGERSDGFEGFARSFLIAALLAAGRDGEDAHGHLERYARGIAAGPDPSSAHAWPRPAQLPQAKVEASSIALGLDLTRPWIWDRLDPAAQQRTITWLREIIGTRYPDNNWVWFRIIALTVLRDLDPETARPGPLREALHADLRHDLALHESFSREGGWFVDGNERNVDHYMTWAFAVLPTLWLRMRGVAGLREDGLVDDELVALHRGRLAAYIEDAQGLLGADGGPLIQGRSLTYRMAVAAPHWAAALAGLADGPDPVIAPGRLRRAASGILGHFLDHGVPDADGLLNLGWFRAFPQMTQDYSGPGSPYWAAKGFLGLALPRTHPVWTAPLEPLPVERADGVELLPVPGWIVSRTRADGIVRVINHGTDHARPGALRPDSPAYARLGYSTATSPPMAGEGERQPQDMVIGLVHPEHGWSHRTGFFARGLREVTAGAQGASVHVPHWHPDGGEVLTGPRTALASLVLPGLEIHTARLGIGAETRDGLELGAAGWPLSGTEIMQEAAEPSALLELGVPRDGGRLRSGLAVLASTLGPARLDVHREEGTSPLGPLLASPQVRLPLHGMDRGDAVLVVATWLRGPGAPAPGLPAARITDDAVVLRLPAGEEAVLPLPSLTGGS
ncbi:DUF2264 domain-containing protein [Brachybacterium hainanense]|uniref:DUF2264 domain-containing protein n=1 Tax=Brachybacterium hainanense TaxID=1541174 RepID=A0ABV6R788_9MICO